MPYDYMVLYMTAALNSLMRLAMTKGHEISETAVAVPMRAMTAS